MLITMNTGFGVRYQRINHAYAHDVSTGKSYAFEVHDIDSRPGGTMDVYAFCKTVFGGYDPIYVGKATDLNNRLSGHEKIDEAKRHGADALLVHSPHTGIGSILLDVEAELIRLLVPPLNRQHVNALAAYLR